jgi:glycosyltransferase involved in cell wall biosynthesis
MVMPRRYGGLCMPVNEALGAGMPVIMPYISPNNSWLSKEWLTPAELKLTTIFRRGNISINVYKTDPTILAKLIDKFATDPHFYQNQAREARALAKKFSWDELAPLYNGTFNNMLKS